MKNFFYPLFAVVATLLSFNLNAQVLQGDSLKGFDETAFINSSVSRGISGEELKSGLAIAKKEHIYSTYYKPALSLSATPSLPHVTTIQPACTNMDFETGTFYGWDLSYGTITNSQTMQGCCSIIGAPQSAIINTGTTMTDPIVPALNLSSPFGGTYIARVKNSVPNATVNRISQTFNVTTSNSVFQLAYAAVLQSSGNHACYDQPGINITLFDSVYNVLPCPNVAFSAPSASCPLSDFSWIQYAGASGGHYKNWSIRTIDLQSYIGSSITVQITISDCTQYAHYGYAYFDMRCVDMEASANANLYNVANRDSVYVSTCGSANTIIGVPGELMYYQWSGPPTSTVNGVTTSTVSTNVPGVYTVTMFPPGSCPTLASPSGTIVKNIILSVSGAPSLSATATQPSCSNASGSGQLSAAGGIAPYSYSWTPAASNNANVNGLIPGNTYTATVTDDLGCRATATLGINPFPDAPTFTITPLNGMLTCASPSLTLSALTGTNTTATWAGTGSASVNVVSQGTYSVTLTNTVSVGQCSTTVDVTVTDNSVPPTAAFSIVCNTNGFDLVANSQPGVALSWLAPTFPNPTPVSNPGSSTAVGVYTLTATDLSTGCQQTYTASTTAPSLSVTTTDSIICPGQVVLLHASGASAYSWNPGSFQGDTYSVTPTVTTTYTVTGFFNSCASAPSLITVSVSPCTGFENLSGPGDVIVYPNPGTGVFTVSGSAYTGKLDVTVMNVLGQTVKTESSKDPGSLVIDLSIYSKGVYYLKIQMKEGSKLLKVMLD